VQRESDTITIYRARRILTVNPSNPVADHVAVQGDRFLGAGPLETLTGWGAYTLNDRFADKVLMPGFVEGHSHTMEGSLWGGAFLRIGGHVEVCDGTDYNAC